MGKNENLESQVVLNQRRQETTIVGHLNLQIKMMASPKNYKENKIGTINIDYIEIHIK